MKKNILFIAFLMLSMLFFNCNRENEQPNEQQNIIPNAVYDVDGNSYDAVRIGKQVWMKTNLRTKHFRDGKAIPMGRDFSNTKPYYYEPRAIQVLESVNEQVPGYNYKTYGLYYNWSAVIDERGLCPTGWHVPSDAEWTELEEYVGSKSEYCINGDSELIAKALAATFGWKNSREEGTPGFDLEDNDITSFSAVPAGYWVDTYNDAGKSVQFWSSTESECYSDGAWHRCLNYSAANMYRSNPNKTYGLSVRCLRD